MSIGQFVRIASRRDCRGAVRGVRLSWDARGYSPLLRVAPPAAAVCSGSPG